jgi:hypothetical protein
VEEAHFLYLQVEVLDMPLYGSVEVVQLCTFLLALDDPDPEFSPANLQRPGQPAVFLFDASEGRV